MCLTLGSHYLVRLIYLENLSFDFEIDINGCLVEIYPAVSRLKELSGFEFCFSRQPGRFNRVSLPEVQLMSLVIIAAKLLYPLDDIKRYPDSLQDPAAQIIDWEAWVETQKEFDLRGKNTERLTRGCEIKVDESDVLQMTPAQLDDYMDWYSKMWIDTKKGTNPFADMFQTDRVDTDEVNPMPPPDDDDDGPEISKKLHKMLSRMKMRRVVADADVMALAEPVARPGSSYKRYRNESQLSEYAKAFYQAAAQVIGASLETMDPESGWDQK
ncbi:hypothetical protein CIRG_04868 [Coccidioides immitis RMSCC 2394]|uniref:Rrn7/TAF1B C-terminal cyclin domain-containing protein n=1 Tax=Coccidioides immitis RMSCC 2394 TaxID=404692 RepID=A0A0J7B5M1_COCIT|nr:hypothetical protein CIRG_04868 [Coccidioides immitis RMSCC 2394]